MFVSFPNCERGDRGESRGTADFSAEWTAAMRRISANTPGRHLELVVDMSSPTILVVDDEPLIRWSVAETLADSGYRVKEAGDARSALQAMAVPGTQTDAVLLDLWLPDSQNLTALSAIRDMSPTTPVIVMTAHGTDDLSKDARSRGAFMTLQKPFDMSVLLPLVEAAVASSRA